MKIMPMINRLIHLESWHPIPPGRPKKLPESAREFWQRLFRLSALRGSMASWALPLEAILALLLTDPDRRPKKRKNP